MTEPSATPPSDDFVLHNQRRAELYRWFAGLFADHLDPVLLRAYRRGAGRRVLDNLKTRPDLAEGADLMEQALDVPRADADLSRALAADFRSLFESGRASPRASSWRAPEEGGAAAEGGVPTRRHDMLARMGDLLRHSGLGLRPGLPGAPDHLAVQLEVLADMADRGLSAWRKAGEPDAPAAVPALAAAWREQLAFLDEDLLAWLPAFRDACRGHDPAGFYGGAATLVTAYCRRDRAYLAGVLGTSAGH